MNRTLLIVLLGTLGLIALGAAVYARVYLPSKKTAPLTVTPTATGPTTKVATPSSVLLVVSTPIEKSVVKTPLVKVSGQSLPNATITVNEVETKADASGNFSTNLKMDEGENPINVMAFDDEGNSNAMDLTVTYEP